MLSAEVANLACLRVESIAWRVFTAVVGIEVCTSGFAAAIFGNSVFMDVVR